MKKNNDSIYFKDWTTAKLRAEAKSYYQSIYEIESYGSSDIQMLAGITEELDNRGIQMSTSIN
jgi:hypothetical protein